MRCMKPNMRWLDKVKSTLQPDEPKKVNTLSAYLLGKSVTLTFRKSLGNN